MYTLKNICNAFNRKFADFIIDNTMLKKLYSVNKRDDPLFEGEKKPETELLTNGPMQRTLEARTSFYYNWKEIWKRKCCSSKICCCCRHKETVADRIFEKARFRLHAEIDLLQIIKQLRTNSFIAQTTLKKHQIDLIRWFSRYCITDKKDPNDALVSNPGLIGLDISTPLEMPSVSLNSENYHEPLKSPNVAQHNDYLDQGDIFT
jgi:hypothetical protein